MSTKKIRVTTTILLSVLTVVLFQVSGKTSEVWAAEGYDKPGSQAQRPHGADADLPNGVIGVSLDVWAERIGDPASLYVNHVIPEGPAQRAGLKHGDEILTVNGATVSGNTYEQVLKMVRGEAGTAVKLGVKGEGGLREIAITRVASEKLYKGEMESHGVIGVSLHVWAEHIGDPASLYVNHVIPEGPAQRAGLKHGDEILTVNGATVSGNTYEQVLKMVRGEAGTAVKLGVKGEGGLREIAITRVASEKLYPGEMGSHGGPAR